jgi:hypothetical protein
MQSCRLNFRLHGFLLSLMCFPETPSSTCFHLLFSSHSQPIPIVLLLRLCLYQHFCTDLVIPYLYGFSNHLCPPSGHISSFSSCFPIVSVSLPHVQTKSIPHNHTWLLASAIVSIASANSGHDHRRYMITSLITILCTWSWTDTSENCTRGRTHA